ncbi:hypothetical protein GGI07_005771 [Coemansia sp. Benny D115]|nr:hypothetical protein GGI07_005771 [Coemansia sp. Benny D115]
MTYSKEHVLSALNTLLEEHADGSQTTIYADDEILQIINSVGEGLVGLLGSGAGIHARNIRRLTDTVDGSTLVLDDGPHILLLLGSAAWAGAEKWQAIARATKGTQVTRCTLLVPTPMSLWSDVLALDAQNSTLQGPLTEASLCQSIRQHAGKPDLACSVHVHSLCARVLPGDLLVVPGAGLQKSVFVRQSEWRDTAQVALALGALVNGQQWDARFYSVGGPNAKRIARRCAAMSRGTGRLTTVVVLDRALDLAAAVGHRTHPLDDLFRTLPTEMLMHVLRKGDIAMLVVAASLLAPRHMKIPPTQLSLAEQRLINDYMAVAHKTSNVSEMDACKWAAWFVERVNFIAGGSMNPETLAAVFDVPGQLLLPRIATDILSGRQPCISVEPAESGATTGASAASLLKGIGRRFMSSRSPPSSHGAGDTFLGPGASSHGDSGQGGHQSIGEAVLTSEIIVLFVAGDITFEEAASMTAAANQYAPRQKVLIGCSGIVTSAAALLVAD